MTEMYGRLSFHLSFMTLGTLRTQHRVDGRQQEVRSVGLGHERIYGVQRILWQFHVFSEHDDGDPWFDLLDLSGSDRAIQESQVVLEHNCIHGMRHEKPQTVGTGGRG